MSLNYHMHHILPKHRGGTDDSYNMIRLTVEEHAEAHRRDWVRYGHWQDELAWLGLSGQISMSEAAKRARRLGCSKSGKINGANNGKKGAPKRTGKLSLTFKDYIIAINKNTKKFVGKYEGRKDLEKNGFDQSSVSKVINKKPRFKSHKGLIFMWEQDYLKGSN